MDNDAKMLEQMGTALTNLQIKYRASSLADQMELRPALDELLEKYSDYQSKLLDEGIITKDSDLADMEEIKAAIDDAAKKQELAVAIAKTIAFIATKAAMA
jgi:hypothetical protein